MTGARKDRVKEERKEEKVHMNIRKGKKRKVRKCRTVKCFKEKEER